VLLEVDPGDGFALEEIYRNEIRGEKLTQIVSISVSSADFPPGAVFGDLVFRFRSDGSGSDEDGGYASDIGAAWIDNIAMTLDGALYFSANFESGTAEGVLFATPAGVGDFAQLYSNLF